MNVKTVQNGGAAMSFDEIGRRLGMSKDNAHSCYEHAMKKLRHATNARALALLEHAVAERLHAEEKPDSPGIVRSKAANIRPLANLQSFSEMEEQVEP